MKTVAIFALKNHLIEFFKNSVVFPVLLQVEKLTLTESDTKTLFMRDISFTFSTLLHSAYIIGGERSYPSVGLVLLFLVFVCEYDSVGKAGG